MRAEANAETMKGPLITAQTKAQMKAAGMDRTVSILRPDKALLYVVMPGRKAYAESPLPKEASLSLKNLSVKKTPLGKETIDGHPCVKNRVILTDPKGNKQEMLTSEASDLNDFPIRVSMVENGQTLLVHNTNIRFGKPAANLFEVPVGYAKVN
jgi:hypothetical protein